MEMAAQCGKTKLLSRNQADRVAHGRVHWASSRRQSHLSPTIITWSRKPKPTCTPSSPEVVSGGVARDRSDLP